MPPKYNKKKIAAMRKTMKRVKKARRPVKRFKKQYQQRAETILISEGTNDTAPAPLCDVFHVPSPPGVGDTSVLVPEKCFFEQTSYNNSVATLDQSLKIVGRSTYTRYVNLRAEIDFTPAVALNDQDTRFRVIMGYLPILMPQNAVNGNSYQKFVSDQFNTYYSQEKLFGGLGQKNVFRIFSDKTYSITPKSVGIPTSYPTADSGIFNRRNIQIQGTFPMTKGKKYYKPSNASGGALGNLVIDSEAGNRINIPFLSVMNVDGLGDSTEGTAPKISYRWAHYFNDS